MTSENTTQFFLNLVDEANEIDSEMEAVANLLSGITDSEVIDEFTICQIGKMILRHIAKHRVLRSYFLNEATDYRYETLAEDYLAMLKRKYPFPLKCSKESES